MHPAMTLPIHNRVLDDQVGLGKLDYERTIRTAELLQLQDHETATVSHDGTIFVIAHQCQELKLKMVAHELSLTIDLVAAGQVGQAIASLDRVRVVFQCLIAELEILETLSPLNYQVVRKTLGKGSGQESPGYNQMIQAGPLMWASLSALIAQRDTTLAALYHDPDADSHLYLLCEAYSTMDGLWQKWLFHHFMLVKRIIGVSHDTNSLAQNKTTMLASSMMRPLFEQLWSIRVSMTHEWVEAQGHGHH
jgi:tryptophan 2,3-dioxygenase